MKKVLLAFVLALVFAAPAFAETRCDNCRMKVRDGSRNKTVVTMKDGSRKVMCSLYCASMEKERSGGEAAGILSVDYLSGEELNAGDAVWVEGSDAPAVMSDKSRVAFKDKAAAEAFVKEHGGRVVAFDEAYGNSVSEWKER